jgi:hypothetical protein
VLVAQVVERIASAEKIGLLAEQLQATAHRHPIVEGPPQGVRPLLLVIRAVHLRPDLLTPTAAE